MDGKKVIKLGVAGLLLIVSIIVIAIGEIIIYNLNAKMEKSEDISIQENKNNQLGDNNSRDKYNLVNFDKKVLYFLQNGFVGFFQNNKWYAPQDLQLNDIFDNSSYTVYTDKYEKIPASRLQLSLGNHGYGGFNYVGLDNDNLLNSELAKYASYIEDDKYIFDLPKKLDGNLGTTYTVDLSDAEMTAVELLANECEYGGENGTKNLITFNDDFDLTFAKEVQIEKIPEDIKDYIKDLLQENGLNKECPYTLIQYFDVDLNKDGKLDQVYNFISDDMKLLKDDKQTTDSIDNIIKEKGTFSLIITKINNNISILDSHFISIDEAKNSEYTMVGSTENFQIYIVDLNVDGIYEILYHVSGWEYWGDYLTIYKNDSYIKLKDADSTQYDLTTTKNY